MSGGTDMNRPSDSLIILTLVAAIDCTAQAHAPNQSLPSALIPGIDETVLDNSEYQA
jgi:hypothetical protein